MKEVLRVAGLSIATFFGIIAFMVLLLFGQVAMHGGEKQIGQITIVGTVSKTEWFPDWGNGVGKAYLVEVKPVEFMWVKSQQQIQELQADRTYEFRLAVTDIGLGPRYNIIIYKERVGELRDAR